jgi:hypothetical protein
MKKILSILAVLSIVAIYGCGGSATTEQKADTTAVKADTTAAPKEDSVTTSAPLEAGKTEEPVK